MTSSPVMSRLHRTEQFMDSLLDRLLLSPDSSFQPGIIYARPLGFASLASSLATYTRWVLPSPSALSRHRGDSVHRHRQQLASVASCSPACLLHSGEAQLCISNSKMPSGKPLPRRGQVKENMGKQIVAAAVATAAALACDKTGAKKGGGGNRPPAVAGDKKKLPEKADQCMFGRQASKLQSLRRDDDPA
ncbi:hypothetical protein GUJ93_ZPchr0001g32754 [Zizania palustris]|uniref:Uncharacterized protein n=1 Tax=Zizania palustris TaxID=103762 RepID=A0A8J5VCY9_ZIZPA|nr:hypothetical protein GUJ93_ZPchr0001g32754 [Zizania palustris]